MRYLTSHYFAPIQTSFVHAANEFTFTISVKRKQSHSLEMEQ